MAMRSIVSRSSFGRFMEGNFQMPTLSGIRSFSDAGKVLDEEGRAKETIYVKKMEKERMEKLKQKAAEKDNADKSDKKGDGDSRKGLH